MAKNMHRINAVAEEIQIPMEFVKRIDRIIGNGMSKYPSRDDFIRNAVEIHLKNAKGGKQ
jgi:Arc/MetJ-type ribon-helix-helix transcriptional regulator